MVAKQSTKEDNKENNTLSSSLTLLRSVFFRKKKADLDLLRRTIKTKRSYIKAASEPCDKLPSYPCNAPINFKLIIEENPQLKSR
jgi:hypothetical protein